MELSFGGAKVRGNGSSIIQHNKCWEWDGRSCRLSNVNLQVAREYN